ncbi:putative Phage terminase, small subunit, P27 [uncultured Pleomorphomonas sp.]|uniref:Putative Phage terminase, small subunit, P27 n=1 Tax=uncultured Pleomorphomonas sp. TaxID=442121 RepID=A0A212KXK6_9HYPH|nr:phage terminase small subunit P27 family [uncultured Pleomorphomonas sp.]SCM70025.1 putative Phage terminase, small subunit, P27 [uncultured Pleomorphomonas sp.]SCM75125.1 putative Phage terminase, small subunit, P27 [uncultured Pleomorphomonas sp.]
MKGTKPHLVVDNGAFRKVPPPPKWLSDEARKEWRRVIGPLVERRILTVADLGSLENYCLSIGRVREVQAEIAAGELDPDTFAKLFRIQDKAMATARLLAAELGLTPVSRSRPTVRPSDEDDDLLE